MKRLKFIVFIELLLGCNMYAQPLSFNENQQAHRRYWYYRTRFVNDFMHIGDKQGDCICFPERNYNDGSSTSAKVGPDQIDINNQYLSALALEYKLLSRSYQSTDITIKEIFYILKTINRLDSRADYFWAASPPTNDNMSSFPENTNLNGFMLREDMPHNYFTSSNMNSNYKHFNYAQTEYNSTATASNLSYTGLGKIDTLSNENKFCRYIDFPGNYPGGQPKSDLTLPHDKYYSMFIAFMMLVKYIPSGTEYYEHGVLQTFQDGESDIKQEVRNITNRCHPYLRGNLFGGPGTNWIMEYPDGTNLQHLGQPAPYSYPIAKMICYINGGYPWSWPCDSKQDGFSLTTGLANYNTLPWNPIPVGWTIGSEDGAVFIGTNMAGSNAPVKPLGGSPIPIPTNVAMQLNSSTHSVEWTDLLRRVLHQKGLLMKQKSVYANPINVAPCTGPYNFGGGDDPGFEWRSQDRLEHPHSRVSNTPPPGNYPGVDYMLLHNLYYEYLNQQSDAGNAELGAYKAAYNLMDNYDTQIWPMQHTISPIGGGNGLTQVFLTGVDANTNQITNPPGPGTLYTSQQPAYIKVFQNLESTANIYAAASPAAPNNTIPAKIEYRAGKGITLKDGFEVKYGADFYAYIKRYVCADADYGSGMRQAQTNDASNDYMNDYMNEMVPIHYIESPLSDADKYPFESETDYNEEMNTFENADAGEFKILPNPSTGIIKIQTKKQDEYETIAMRIYDMRGVLIRSLEDIPAEQEINLEGYSEGIYMIQIMSSYGKSITKKVEIIK